MEVRDIDDVWALEKLCFSIPWAKNAFLIEIAENKCAKYFVAVCKDVVLGYGGMWLMLDEAHITNIAVHPSRRGKGIGGGIMKALINEAIKNGADKMTLEVRVTNKDALKLYTGMGFKGVGVRKGYYADTDEDALIMWKHIDEAMI